jgi:hypothetical protein
MNKIVDLFCKLADRLQGGLADNLRREDFDQSQLSRGITVEMAHTSDRTIATEIAMDNLKRNKQYYNKLPTDLQKTTAEK